MSELHYAEAVCALGALTKGGSLVLKMFNLFECETICLLYILALHFNELNVFKPASSRAPNGETYIVALQFRGIDKEVLNSLLSFVSPQFPSGKALLPRESIPQSFINALIEIADYFNMQQIHAIERNLDLERIWNRNVEQAIFQLNEDAVEEFRRICHIDYKYQQTKRIVTNVELDGSARVSGNSASVVKGGFHHRGGGTLDEKQIRKSDREKFLLDQDTHEEDKNKKETTEKRISLGQGKTVAIGRDGSIRSKTNNEVEIMEKESSIKKTQEPVIDSKVMRMMKKSGYIEGQGLGAQSQGRVAPIETFMHDTRLGLGHHYQASINSFSSADMPKVADEPSFSSFDRPITAGSSLLPPNVQTLTIGSNLRCVLSSLFVTFDDLELLYKKREEYLSKSNNYDSTNMKIFISDQLELLNKDENYSSIHGICIYYRAAFELASLDKLFKLVRSKK